MGRSPVGGGSWEPRFLTTLGVVPGKQQGMGIANALQDEVIRRLGMVETEAQYTESGVGVFYHAWLASAKAKHVYVIHARSQMIQENVAAALTGDVIPMVDGGTRGILRGERNATVRRQYLQV